MHGQVYFIGEIYYGFNPNWFYVRVDPLREPFEHLGDCEFRFVLQDESEMKLSVRFHDGQVANVTAERNGTAFDAGPDKIVVAAGKIIELSIAKKTFSLTGQKLLRFSVSLWRAGLPIDLVPPEGLIEVPLDKDSYTWHAE